MLLIKLMFGAVLLIGLLVMTGRGEPTERLAYYGGFTLFTLLILEMLLLLLIS